MHEAAIAEGVLKTALDARTDPTSRVSKIVVVAGAMNGIVKESLEMYLSLLAEGTPAKGAVLELKIEEARLKCTQCGQSRAYDPADAVEPVCASCGGANQLQASHEVYIEYIETEQ